MFRKRMAPWLLTGTLAISAAMPVATRAIDLKDVTVGGGIAVAVNQFGGEINDFVNRISGTKGRAAQATKVVPIITAGKGGREARRASLTSIKPRPGTFESWRWPAETHGSPRAIAPKPAGARTISGRPGRRGTAEIPRRYRRPDPWTTP